MSVCKDKLLEIVHCFHQKKDKLLLFGPYVYLKEVHHAFAKDKLVFLGDILKG